MTANDPPAGDPQPFLDFYGRHRISPVAQDISDLHRHFARREVLYRQLGIIPRFLQGRRIVEFGPGSGHNALFTNSLQPARHLLVEGNPVGLAESRRLLDHYFPEDRCIEVVSSRIEEYPRGERFDLVLCENVIPWQRDPLAFLRRVADFAEVGGIVLITCMDAVSFFSEMLRRLVGMVLVRPEQPLEEQLAILRDYFAPHLATLKGMSRSVDDWILDNLLQPCVGEFLSIDQAIGALDPQFEIYGSSPRFLVDYRWYKAVPEQGPSYNGVATQLFYENLHDLLDYRFVFPPRSAVDNRVIMGLCNTIAAEIVGFEHGRERERVVKVVEGLGRLIPLVREFSLESGEALAEMGEGLAGYLEEGRFSARMERFAPFFGRGVQYLSFVRKA